MFTLASALIGAMIGSIGAVIIEKHFDKRREELQARKILIQRYIFQLQDAIEDLYYRLYNLWREGGYGAMEKEYFEVTTLYALGKVLAVEHIIALEGVYPQLDILDELGSDREFGNSLRNRRKDLQLRELLGALGFQRYDQRTLAESTIEYSANSFRPSTFLEFKKRCCEVDEEQGQKWLSQARANVHKLHEPSAFSDAETEVLLSRFEKIAYMIADKTMVKSAISSEPSYVAEKQ